MAALGSTASEIQSTYMTLLITQLRNQNPLEPMDNNQMASQLAQLSQLEQLESMNGTFSKVLASQQVSQASGLIGKQVAYMPANSTELVWGKVDSIAADGAGKVTLKCGTTTVNLDDVREVRN